MHRHPVGGSNAIKHSLRTRRSLDQPISRTFYVSSLFDVVKRGVESMHWGYSSEFRRNYYTELLNYYFSNIISLQLLTPRSKKNNLLSYSRSRNSFHRPFNITNLLCRGNKNHDNRNQVNIKARVKTVGNLLSL